MKRIHKFIIALGLILLLSIIGNFLPTKKVLSQTENQVKLEQIETSQDDIKVQVTPNITTEDKNLILRSPQLKSIDIEPLKSQLGDENVTEDTAEEKLTLNLKNFDSDHFDIAVVNENEFKLTINDSDNNTLEEESFDKVIPSDNQTKSIDDETDSHTEWKRTYNLKVSKGNPGKLQSDGSRLTPVIYFGSLQRALDGYAISSSVKPVGGGSNIRQNNVTAANSAIIAVDSKGKFNRNNVHTFTKDNDQHASDNFVTTNIYDYHGDAHNDDFKYPLITGPDYKSTNNNFNASINHGSVKLYYQTDHNTGLEKQRLTFEQQYKKTSSWPLQNVILLFKVKISITISFDKNNNVHTNITYKNIGKNHMPHFTGYVFRDITLGENFKDSTSGNDFLSLGNNEGLYVVNKNLGSKIEFYLHNLDYSPDGWATSIGRPIFFGADGYPWKKTNIKFPFNDIYDKGFAEREPDQAGEIIETDKEKSTLALHTRSRVLNPGDSVNMSYITYIDAETKKHPNIILSNNGTVDNPDELKASDKTYHITGNWFDYSNQNVQLFYTMDNENMESAIPFHTGEQSIADMEIGKPHHWELNRPIQNLDHGLHTVRIFARTYVQNPDGTYKPYDSDVHTTVFRINTNATNTPQIEIDSPLNNSSEKNTYTPTTDTIDLGGEWSDADSDSVNFYYSLDGQPKQIFKEAVENSPKGKPIHWRYDDFPIDKIVDDKIHQLKIIAQDANGNAGEDTLYFKNSPGYFTVESPQYIDFGLIHHINQKSVKVNPKLDSNLLIRDTRKYKFNPIKLSLKIAQLRQQNTSNADSALDADFYWGKDIIPIDNQFFPIGESQAKNPDNWETVSDFTDVVNKKLSANIDLDSMNTSGSKKYSAKWYWCATDAP